MFLLLLLKEGYEEKGITIEEKARFKNVQKVEAEILLTQYLLLA